MASGDCVESRSLGDSLQRPTPPLERVVNEVCVASLGAGRCYGADLSKVQVGASGRATEADELWVSREVFGQYFSTQ